MHDVHVFMWCTYVVLSVRVDFNVPLKGQEITNNQRFVSNILQPSIID